MKKSFQHFSVTVFVFATALGSPLFVPGLTHAQTVLVEKNQQVQTTRSTETQTVRAMATEAEIAAARTVVEHAFVTLQNLVASAKTTIQKSKDISNKDRARLIARLNTEAHWLSDQSTDLATVPLSVIKQQAKTLNAHKAQTKAIVQQALGEAQGMQVLATAQKFQAQNTKAQKLIAQLDKKGKASAELKASAAAYSATVKTAIERAQQGIALFQSLAKNGASDADYQKGMSLLASSRDQLKQANTQLQKLTVLLKDAASPS